MTTWLLLACSGASVDAPAPAVDEALAAELPECRAYADDPDTFAYCAYSRIQQVRGLAEARRVCALAGTWQESCSEVWATDPRNCREDLDGLLSMCPTASCRFAVLDACPSEDVVAQSALCLERAGEFSECCTGHAGQRWLADEPDAHDIAAAMSFEGPHADVLGIWSALAMQDLGEGSCEDPPGDLAPTAGAVDGCTKTRLRCEDDPSYCSGLRKAKRGAVDVGCTNALVEVLGQLPGRGVAEDEALCREGEAGTEMWVLVEGRIRVEKQDLTGVPRRLARIDAPAMLGHMALAGVWPRSASCIADVDSRVLSISRAHFDTLMDDLGPNGDIFRRVLIAGMSRQLGRGNAQLRAMLLPAFEDCDTEIMDRDMLNAQATFDGWVG